jgi:hypothetical protein
MTWCMNETASPKANAAATTIMRRIISIQYQAAVRACLQSSDNRHANCLFGLGVGSTGLAQVSGKRCARPAVLVLGTAGTSAGYLAGNRFGS